ncbi:virulence factor Mce family protein [Mycobacterium shimoidei]|uniref:Mce-family protein Mce1C [Mycobacterium tuberculosis H37Rv] n=1 Tax=Mycobacterium shimoidei TaxID=29313 RepID=A0A1E3TJX1_MYCSH|nr:virulence factor Mce family protein [Mycobacterium shimoidei]MCV7259355.1 MCE family protein [Mycobacterium shimoidei]ODR14761.1 mammalian cell entry protein [Mycobacterium shimoidei]ORW81126.1 mammalian cell entry protein [Mycobacterium shimoidei]SRX93445.1 Mce-family protein Mce1C [Mycobacterium tuberculosis H37Rv] [Mycobacterium shimoidei]
MRTLTEFNRFRVGLVGVVVLALVVVVGQSFTSVPMLFASPSYYGQFANTGQLSKNDKVRITGVDVGTVQGLELDGDHVLIKFSIGANTIGTDSRLAIKTDTILGKKILEIEPRGTQPLRPGGTLPLGQTTTPYQLFDAVFDVTKAATGWDTDTVKQSLNVLSQTVNQTYTHLSPALDGLAKLSDTIGKRDEEIKHLLAQANKVASVLGDRSEQINRLLINAKTLLAAFNERGRAIDALLHNVSAFSAQVQGLINDNPNLNSALEQLRTLSDLLVERKNDLAQGLQNIGQFAASLGESVASGPYFKIVLSNLLPYWIMQPWVDAAFKKRGIDPEDFWRSAGLPAFRWPDPNGTRFPNGAPPPAPPVLEGTPDHPGPAVPPGSACSYTPAPDALPRPWNPLPCANVDAGPFGGSFPAPLDVQTSDPNPEGLPPTPGIPIAGRPGEAPPNVPGTPVPIAPGPPGARSEPLGPAGPPPPPSTFAPGLPPGPPAPPGPGPQLPAPFITPGGTGGSPS